MTDRDDRILDACLEEALGGQTPPDLTKRILHALATRPGGAAPASLPGDSLRTGHPAPVILREGVSPVHSSTSARASTWKRPAWLAAAVAASFLTALVAYGLIRSFQQPGPADNLAQQPPAPIALADNMANAPPVDEAPMPAHRQDDAVAITPQVPQPPVVPQSPPESIATSKPAAVESPSVKPDPPRQVASASRSDEEIIAEINALVRRRWSEEGVKPAALATDAEWCRRVYLDIVGRIPTYEETARFLAERGPQRRARLIERLLDSDDGVQEYARNWTNIWAALLIGRSDEPGSMANRDGMQQYLRRSLLRNKPYDEMVAELISADGASTPGAADFNGAVNFVLDNLQENAVSATAKTARLFLGMQVQCTQCHNHPFNDWKQDQFWELNSFYRQAKALPQRTDGQAVTRLVDVDFAGEAGNNLNEAEVYWEMRNGLVKVSYPAFVDGTRIDPNGAVEKINRRDELARLVARSPQMPRALVNRLWGHFLGYGLTRPVDDMGPHNPPSHPELLDLLAGEFAHGYDMKRVIRWFTLSEPYALSSRIPPATLKDGKDDPVAGTTPLFSYFYVRQMRAEEVYESLLAFAGQREQGGSYEEQERAKTEWLRQFTASYETEENDEYTTFNGSIPQTLAMFNGELVREATKVEKGTFLRTVAASNEQSTAKISQLFTAALARKPTTKELQLAHQLWLGRKGDGNAALQDIWWAVLNSNEFIMNH